jgi:hypothetical protein
VFSKASQNAVSLACERSQIIPSCSISFNIILPIRDNGPVEIRKKRSDFKFAQDLDLTKN